MATLDIRLLGTADVKHGGQPVSRGASVKAIGLLAYLAVESDRPHQRASLADLFWPEQPEDRARHSLRQALSTLRRMVGDNADRSSHLLISRDSIVFNRGSTYSLDVEEFDLLLDTAERHEHQRLDTCQPCLGRIERAMALYRGDFLAGFSPGDSVGFDDWSQIQRQRIQQRALDGLTIVGNQYQQREELEMAIPAVRRQLEIDPWLESAHRQLMELLWKVGRRNDALAQYERCRQALADELDVEPEDETIELYTRIRSTGAALRRTAVNLDKGTGLGRLPAPATRLVGRRQELEDVADMLGHRDCRLLSLIGPGGSGKTRLAIQIATDQTGSFPDGVWLVRLALVRDRDGIAPAIAAELGLRMTGSNEPEQHLFDWLRDRALLLVLDNAEHLVDHMGVVSRILAASRYVKLLITSRERLRLQGEWVYDIGGLPVPTGEGTDAFEGYGAVELFCDRLRQVRPRVPLRHEERPLVAQICRMVDGMPLAIELAAAWAQTLSLEQIAEEIRRNLDFLSSSIRDVPDRHQSIRTVFDQTWNMLTEEEQTAYRRLSIFRDGFSLQAAESVTGTPSALLASLVSKSLVVHLPTERFRLHELLRHYGEERLRLDESQFLAMHRRHCDYFLEYVAEREEALTGRAQQSALADIGIEIENLQAAWRWGTQQCRVAPMSDAMHALWLFYVIRGWMREGSSLFGSLLVDLAPASSSECEDSTARTLTMANATMRFGGFQSGLGHYHEATESLANGASRLREFDAPRELGLALNMLAAVVLTTGDYQQSRSHLQESLELFRRIDDAWGIALSLNDLGLISLMVGAVDEAYASCEDSRARFRRMGDKRGQAFAASNLATIATERGDLSHARRMHHEALALRQESDDRWGVASSHAQLGTVARLANSAQEAREHFVTALRMAWDSSITPVVLETLVELSALDIDEGDLARASDTLAVVAAHPATNGSVQERIADLTGTDLLDQETLVTRMSGNRWAVQAVDDLVRALLD